MKLTAFRELEQSATISFARDDFDKLTDFRLNVIPTLPAGNGKAVIKLLLDLLLDGPPVTPPAGLTVTGTATPEQLPR